MGAVSAAPRRRLARFELLRELGRGAQATVWLAHDPRLEREVALKLLSPAADEQAVSLWLHEARAVSRLTHPHIVPVFEADEHEGQSYLVFEYVEGPTLAQARRHQPPMPARQAVQLLLGVLDALAAAHAQGVVHRDLKPSNVLLGRDGRARVMDFGIAARLSHGPDVADGRIVGTPGYMSPEAARGESPQPAMDVFAAGALLGELLCGRPLLRETDPWRAVQRVQHEDLVLPAQPRIDETLRGIVQRALARDVRARYDGARALHAALSAWLQPEASALPEAGSSHATLEFLLRRMRHKTDFPALSSSVVRIQHVATSEKETLKSLSDEILKDVALTNKLLRMVNTAHFSAVAGGGVATVSRAVALVGFAGIRNMALSLVLLEHMSDKAHAAQLRAEFLRALMAGTLANEFATLQREGEEAFLAAMFQNLGRLLAEYYFPDEALQVRQQLGDGEASAERREAAARRVLGIGYDELGAGVAKAWGLPDSLQRALQTPRGEPPARLPERMAERGIERMRWLGRGANAIADALLSAEGESQAHAVAAAAQPYAHVLGLSVRELVAATQSARTQLTHLASAMGLHVAVGTQARRLLDTVAATVVDAQAGTGVATLPAPTAASSHGLAAASAAHEALAQAHEQARLAVNSPSLQLSDLLQTVLQAMHKALEFRRVVFCLREATGGRLVGRIGLGSGAAELSGAFKVTPQGSATDDLFAVLCAKGADLLVADSRTVARRLPSWYRERVNAPTFLLLPVMHKGIPIGLIYADKDIAGSLVLDERHLALLRALRDHLSTAFGRGR